MEDKGYYQINKKMLTGIIADKTISPGAKVVLWSLINRLCGKDYAYPSQRVIALDTALGERQVRNNLKKLHEKGIIVWVRGSNRANGKGRANSNRYDLSKILWRKK
jgi:DNA-binding transcriptional regulator YhcF (GntR family)